MSIDNPSAIPDAPVATETADGVIDRSVTFSYRGWLFRCGTKRIDADTYEPVVFCRLDAPGAQAQRLPSDTENTAYGSEVEALRHAEQQAIRWVHDHTGEGQ